MQSRTKNILTIRFSADAEVNSFLNTIQDGENPFSFKKILQLSDDPKVNESRSDLLAYATIKHFGTDPRNYKPDGLAEMMKNYFHFYGWQVMSDSVEEPEAVKVDVDGEHYVHIEFNTKDHTPSPIMAALSFLFSKEMLYVKYASNDIAAYEDPLMLRKCGFYRCKAGHFTEGFGLRGYEAAEEACKMWGYTLSDYVSEGVVNGKYRVFWHKHKA